MSKTKHTLSALFIPMYFTKINDDTYKKNLVKSTFTTKDGKTIPYTIGLKDKKDENGVPFNEPDAIGIRPELNDLQFEEAARVCEELGVEQHDVYTIYTGVKAAGNIFALDLDRAKDASGEYAPKQTVLDDTEVVVAILENLGISDDSYKIEETPKGGARIAFSIQKDKTINPTKTAALRLPNGTVVDLLGTERNCFCATPEHILCDDILPSMYLPISGPELEELEPISYDIYTALLALLDIEYQIKAPRKAKKKTSSKKVEADMEYDRALMEKLLDLMDEFGVEDAEYCGYQAMSYAMADSFGEDGLDYIQRYSDIVGGYEDADIEAQYMDFVRNDSEGYTGDKKTIGSVVNWAKDECDFDAKSFKRKYHQGKKLERSNDLRRKTIEAFAAADGPEEPEEIDELATLDDDDSALEVSFFDNAENWFSVNENEKTGELTYRLNMVTARRYVIEEKHYYKYAPAAGEKRIYCTIVNKILYPTKEVDELETCITAKIGALPLDPSVIDALKTSFAEHTPSVRRSYWMRLLGIKTVDDHFIGDIRNFYLFAKNKVVVLNHKTLAIEEYDYSDDHIDGFLYEDEIKSYDWLGEGSDEGEAKDFINTVSGEDAKTIRNQIAHVSRRFKAEDSAKAMVLYDDTAAFYNAAEHKKTGKTHADGGKGKTIIGRYASNFVNVLEIDAKNFDPKEKFRWSQYRPSRVTILVDDLDPKKGFEPFYGIVNGMFNFEKKFIESESRDFTKSPHLMVTSNYLIHAEDNATARRIFPSFVGGPFNKNYEPVQKYGHLLFRSEKDGGWSAEEWNKFFNYMFNCFREYLKDGLTQSTKKLSYRNATLAQLLSASSQLNGEFRHALDKLTFKELMVEGNHPNRKEGKANWGRIYSPYFRKQIEGLVPDLAPSFSNTRTQKHYFDGLENYLDAWEVPYKTGRSGSEFIIIDTESEQYRKLIEDVTTTFNEGVERIPQPYLNSIEAVNNTFKKVIKPMTSSEDVAPPVNHGWPKETKSFNKKYEQKTLPNIANKDNKLLKDKDGKIKVGIFDNEPADKTLADLRPEELMWGKGINTPGMTEEDQFDADMKMLEDTSKED